MKAYVITHVSSFEPRAEAVGNWLREQGADVSWICSDFDHIGGCTVSRVNPDHIYLHLDPYQKNLSLKRMKSIYSFAESVGKYLSGRQFDLLYIIVPANSFVPVAEKLKKQSGAKVVFDILDLWPESIPIPGIQKLPPLKIWRNLRDRHISCADLIFTECRLYQELISLPREKTHTLYLFGKNEEEISGSGNNETADISSPLRVAYLGSINYLIDVPMITEVLSALQKKTQVTVDVIGEGETKEKFLKALEQTKVTIADHGAVFDEDQKKEILSKCRFGLNMMV
ncbi:MAG: hypothetical protein HUJ73_02135, partial [Eubacterium sp.]|nr:hypothetical protein [Eubacterium sp.]